MVTPTPPKLDYETPAKRFGFLSRVNPNATARSVIRKAISTTVVAAAIWAICLWLRPNPLWQPTWPMFALWLTIAAGVGAVWEWQVVESDDD